MIMSRKILLIMMTTSAIIMVITTIITTIITRISNIRIAIQKIVMIMIII